MVMVSLTFSIVLDVRAINQVPTEFAINLDMVPDVVVGSRKNVFQWLMALPLVLERD